MHQISRLIQLSLLGLVSSTISSTTTLAAPPTAFGGWGQNGGVVSGNCPSNFVCADTISDQGIMQRSLTDANGKRFFQTVVYDQAADGTTLSSESFVQGNNAPLGGISLKQVMGMTGTTTINSETIINSGWAAPSGSGSHTYITQDLSDNSYNGVTYTDSFMFESSQDSNENTVGYYLDIRQEVIDSAGNATPPDGSIIEGSLSGTASGQDKHVFVTRKASGIYVPGSGSASLPASAGMGGMMGGGGQTGGTVSWQVGDEVQVLWIGQVCEGCQTGGMMGGGGMGGGGSAYSYQAYSNLSDGTTAATQSLSGTSPTNWVSDPFGATPQF